MSYFSSGSKQLKPNVKKLMTVEEALAWADQNTQDPAVLARLRSRRTAFVLAREVRALRERLDQLSAGMEFQDSSLTGQNNELQEARLAILERLEAQPPREGFLSCVRPVEAGAPVQVALEALRWVCRDFEVAELKANDGDPCSADTHRAMAFQTALAALHYLAGTDKKMLNWIQVEVSRS